MNKLKTLAKIAVLLLFVEPLSAQQSVHSSGGEAQGQGGTVSYSISNNIKSGDQNPH